MCQCVWNFEPLCSIMDTDVYVESNHLLRVSTHLHQVLILNCGCLRTYCTKLFAGYLSSVQHKTSAVKYRITVNAKLLLRQ